jgi:hypothetical protein
MSRKKKQPHRRRRLAERRVPKDQLIDDVVLDTAAVFTCSEKVAQDFSSQCDERLAELESDVAFNRVAQDIWAGRPGRAAELASALAALVAERERQIRTLTELGARFAALAADDSFHEHIDPVEPWRDFVRKRLFPETIPA